MLRSVVLKSIVIGMIASGVSLVNGAEIVMHNGDRISGSLRGIEDGLLTLEHPYSESELKIPVDAIENISEAENVRVYIENGDSIRGEITGVADHTLLLQTSYQGRLEVPFKDVKRVAGLANGDEQDGAGGGPGEAETVDRAAAGDRNVDSGGTEERADDRERDADDETLGPQPERRRDLWSGSLSAGGNRQTGNTDRTSATFDVEAARETDFDKLSLLFRYNYAEEDDSVTARNVYGQIGYDYDITARTYWLLETSLLSDEFRELDLRTTSSAGVGYRWIDRDDIQLATEAGLTYITRNYESGDDENGLSARLAGIFEWDVSETFSFTEEIRLYPALGNGSDIVKNEAGIKSQITNAWYLHLRHVIDHDTDPPEGLKKTDTKLILSLGYDF